MNTDISINIKDDNGNHWTILGASKGTWLPLDASNLGTKPKWPMELTTVHVGDDTGYLTWLWKIAPPEGCIALLNEPKE